MAEALGFSTLADSFGIPLWLLLIVLVWSLSWKLIAMWKAAKRNSPVWFIALAIVNTMGIFEILYYYLFSEIKLSNLKNQNTAKKRKK